MPDAGGKVTIFTQPGQPSYQAEERNSVNSSLMDYSHSSFSLTPGLPDHGGSVTFYRQLGQSSYLGTQGNCVTSKPSGYWKTSFSFATELTEAPDCTTTADEPMFYTQSSSKIFSPPSSADSASNVWGIVVYASVSSICKAAIHDGRISSNQDYRFIIEPNDTCLQAYTMDRFHHRLTLQLPMIIISPMLQLHVQVK
ncbi:uncharacterized protein LOC143453036 [Clavelina lepadiformis]|uniref:uncharacterized protein LOC143453036 n=1 Tax=Clavelina lepadiformis TaxID=159417 RepID=UPI00404239EE